MLRMAVSGSIALKVKNIIGSSADFQHIEMLESEQDMV